MFDRERRERSKHGGFLHRQKPTQDQSAARFRQMLQFGGRRHEQSARQIREDDIGAGPAEAGHYVCTQIADFETDARMGIELAVVTRRRDRVFIVVDANNRSGAQEARRDREYPGTGPHIHDRTTVQIEMLKGIEAEAGRRVMPGAETHRRSNHNHHVVGVPAPGYVPRRCDDDLSDSNGTERSLRSGGPVFVRDIDTLECELREVVAKRLGGAVAFGRGVKEDAPPVGGFVDRGDVVVRERCLKKFEAVERGADDDIERRPGTATQKYL